MYHFSNQKHIFQSYVTHYQICHGYCQDNCNLACLVCTIGWRNLFNPILLENVAWSAQWSSQRYIWSTTYIKMSCIIIDIIIPQWNHSQFNFSHVNDKIYNLRQWNPRKHGCHKHYNKNQWVVYPCLEIQVNCFWVGIFHESFGLMKYPYTKTMNLHLQTRIHHELVLGFMPYYFCFDYIMFNVQF